MIDTLGIHEGGSASEGRLLGNIYVCICVCKGRIQFCIYLAYIAEQARRMPGLQEESITYMCVYIYLFYIEFLSKRESLVYLLTLVLCYQST